MEEKKVCPGCCHKTKDRPEKEYKDLMNRLSRIEGQVRGVRRMVEEGAYCPDILIQVAAANAALNSFSRELLAQHIGSCVADDLRAGSDEKLEELLRLLPPGRPSAALDAVAEAYASAKARPVPGRCTVNTNVFFSP